MPSKKQDEEHLPLLPEAGSDLDESVETLSFMRNASENQGRIHQCGDIEQFSDMWQLLGSVLDCLFNRLSQLSLTDFSLQVVVTVTDKYCNNSFLTKFPTFTEMY